MQESRWVKLYDLLSRDYKRKVFSHARLGSFLSAEGGKLTDQLQQAPPAPRARTAGCCARGWFPQRPALTPPPGHILCCIRLEGKTTMLFYNVTNPALQRHMHTHLLLPVSISFQAHLFCFSQHRRASKRRASLFKVLFPKGGKQSLPERADVQKHIKCKYFHNKGGSFCFFFCWQRAGSSNRGMKGDGLGPALADQHETPCTHLSLPALPTALFSDFAQEEAFFISYGINVMTVTWTELKVQRQAFLAKDLKFLLKKNKKQHK